MSEIVGLELDLLRPEVRRDAVAVEALLDPAFVEVGASGRLWTRPDMLRMLATERDRPPVEVHDVQVVDVAEGVVLLLYVTDAAGRRVRRSSLWRLSEGRWRLLHHQGTPVP